MSESKGIMGLKIKIMPTSPSVDLEAIKNEAKKIVEMGNGYNREYVEEPIAFGLKAIIAFFEWPEEKPLEELENKFKAIKDVSSIDIIDMRKIA